MSQRHATWTVPSHVPKDLVIDFDAAADPGLKVDLFRRLAELRDSAPPIAFSPYNGGHWLVFRNADIQTVLGDADNFSSAHISAGSIAQGGPPMIPVGIDPPEHAPWRVLILRHLGPARVRQLETVIRRKAEELVSALVDATSCEFVTAVAEPMPVSIFMELLGLPAEQFADFRSLALQVLNPDVIFGDPSRIAAANASIVSILSELIAARSGERRHDLVSALLDEQVDGQPIGGPELLSICYVLFLGGLDTVTNAMSFGMRDLAQDPVWQEALRNDPDQIPAAVERLLRRSAFINVQRSVKRDTTLGGVSLKAGDLIWNMTYAGSNEPAGETEGSRHLAFGGGHHLCAGMHLARMELRIFYETWFARIGRFRLAAETEPTMGGGPIMHIKRLQLMLEPAASASPA